MKKQLRKFLNVRKSVVCMWTLTAFVLGTSSMCYATTPALYDFETAWDGNGSVEIVLDWAKPEELLKVSLGDVTLGDGDYTVKPYKDGLKLEITEKGLRKMPLKLGSNFMWVKIAGRRDNTFVRNFVILEDNQTEVSFAKSGATEILGVYNAESTDLLSLVDKTDYTVSESAEEFTIKFNEDYLKTLDSKKFGLTFLEDCNINLRLIKGKLGDANADGKIDLNDAKLLLKTSLGIEKDSTEIKMLADYDKDDKITLSDAKSCLKAALGI